ncbi:MAG: hypothetical protein HOV87_17965, partial [Catenulispora sp.]|nr:hypothetical protein [Catenulispora sp.]
WRALLGQNVIQLDDLDAVCETIALTIGLAEDRIDLDTGLADLREVGSRAGRSVERALGGLQARRVVRDRRGQRRDPRDTRNSGEPRDRHPIIGNTQDPAVTYLRSRGADYTYDTYDNRPESRWS